MPGPPVFRGDKLVAAARSGEVPEGAIDEKVLRILRLARRTGALGGPPDRRRRRSTFEASTILCRAAVESFVLLKNDGGVLPLAADSNIAVLGRVAALPPLQGGGSANVGPIVAPSPLQSIRVLAATSGEIRYEPGYPASAIPRLDLDWVDARGFTVEILDASRPSDPPIEVQTQRTDRFIFREVIAGRRLADLTVRIRTTLTPPSDGEYVFGVNAAGACSLRIANAPVLELGAEHTLDWSYLFQPESRALARVELEGGKPIAFELEYTMTPGPRGDVGLVTLRAQPPEPDDLLQRAVDAARTADAAVVFVGLGEEYECEGYDRASFQLPTAQTDLVAAVAEANPKTVVVLSAGAPVAVDWAEDVPALLVVWYGGQELGPALADVLMGRAEPGGRLPVTFPARLEDSAVPDPAPQGGKWDYREGLFVGHRHFDRHDLEPAYCFGHGLGYTEFGYEDLRVEPTSHGEVDVVVRVRNRGARRGKDVVQIYVGSEDPTRPIRELKAFGRIELDAGADGELVFTLGRRAFSQWDSALGRFVLIPGRHEIAAGRSSRDLRLTETVTFAREPATAR
jgi:beta-glucosidase